MSMNETGSGEGVEVIVNEPYDNEKGKGHRVPSWIAAFLPKGAFEMHEEAWNAYPHCLTVMTSPFIGSVFKVVTETMHVGDRGETENALNLDAKVLAQRIIDDIDVTNDKEIGAYKESEDPKLYKSTKTGRGPLTAEDWRKTCEPCMTCYKLVTTEFSWWGFQTAMERYIQSMMRGMFALFHRQLFCDTDGWYRMTIEELRAMEDETAKKLLDKRNQELTTKTEFS
ncbi:hypothetical protein LPJ60_004595 [Coemansia sp. RSA 2675]|nr:hypothetical protein LPJ60_004595 [Coemansia sp. RSA 2675]